MKYKFKAYLGPIISLLLVIVAWGFIAMSNMTFDGGTTYIRNWFFELFPVFGNVTSTISNIYSKAIPVIMVILLIFTIINAIKGIKVGSLLKKQTLTQGDLSYDVSKKIRRVHRIYKLSLVISLIIFIPTIPSAFSVKVKRTHDYSNCEPQWNPQTNNFIPPPGC